MAVIENAAWLKWVGICRSAQRIDRRKPDVQIPLPVSRRWPTGALGHKPPVGVMDSGRSTRSRKKPKLSLVMHNDYCQLNGSYTQVDVPVMIQSASVFGIWGIEFLLALVANAIALVIQSFVGDCFTA
jgi:hypothetical protein